MAGVCGLLIRLAHGQILFGRQKIHIYALANGWGIQYNILIGVERLPWGEGEKPAGPG